jgi:LDH2 family malate/lactate/ureidoglycolate dehydrogenase
MALNQQWRANAAFRAASLATRSWSMADHADGVRYRASDLIEYATRLLGAAGCDGDKPATIATGLVEADLLGHTTHGLQLAPTYLNELASGGMLARGEPEVVTDRLATVTWDGRQLPGVWLAARAVNLAVERAPTYGVVTVAIRRSHHIGCLAAFLQSVTDRGFMILLACSDPAVASVAPFGGRKALFTPNPFAIGIPTDADPILIDISASITTNGMSNRLRQEGKVFPSQWALDAEGNATDDPAALFANPPGTLLPVGGLDHGHKGYGLALMVEALTQGLSGFGRAESPTQWGASVFVQVIDPGAFAGADAFRQQSSWLAAACRDNPPAPGVSAVRVPGQRGLERKRQALSDGVELYPSIMGTLAPFAAKFGITPPDPVAG